MQCLRSGSIQRLIWLLAAVMLLPQRIFAQELVSPEMLDEWFYSRLICAAVAGALAGILVGLAHLCRLRFKVDSLDVNRQARRKFLIWSLVVVICGAIMIFLDAWLLYPFGTNSLAFGETLRQVWLNYRVSIILFTLIGAFILMVVISTRLKSDCRCRYAFLPGPRGK